MPTTSHTVTLSINAVDRSELLLRDSVYIRHTQNNDATVAEFTLKSVSYYQPIGWHSVRLHVNGVMVFGGFIQQSDPTSIGVGSTRQTNWQIQCKDWSVLLDGIDGMVTEKYTGRSDAYIIADLFTGQLAGEAFDTSTKVTSLNSDIDISFERITVREALNQLADRVNATWYIDPNKQLFWNIYNGFGVSAFNIDTVAPNRTTTFDVAYSSLRRQIDASNIVNRVIVVGGNAEAGPRQTDIFNANGVTDTFGPLTQRISSMWSAVYTIGGSALSVYATNIGYEPQDDLAAEGGTYSAIVNLENGTIRIRSSTGAVPDNGTTVTVSYYYAVAVETTLEHSGSRNYYGGRLFIQTVYDENLTSIASAEEYAQRVLDRYAFARETISFDVYEHGLLPGTLIQINAPDVGLTNTRTLATLAGERDLTTDYQADPDFDLLTEGSNSLEQESYGSNAVYLIQEVQIQPQVTSQGHFMMVAKVTCGDRQHTIIDVLKKANSFGTSAGTGRTPAKSQYGRLSSITTNLGEVVSGRALFTDGGTAQFSWSNYSGHTGAVVGLEDINSNTYGASYILDAGTVKAKMGRMVGMPALGTVTPTGWGIYTTNGYFSGAVVASQVVGGTITGGQITGGTVTGGLVTGGTVSGALLTGGTANITVGNIGGFVVAANQLYSNGGTISTGAVVNSSNPGVLMGTAGLFGFGTLGLTFALYTDPARAPWFSSGTINNAVYEVYESAILRTSADVFANGGIQMDNSGIFAVNPLTGAGALLTENSNVITTEDGRALNFAGLNFMVDALTGNMYAENGYFIGAVYATEGVFTGTVSASSVIGGTVIGSEIVGNNITGGTINGATIVGIDISGISITGSSITGGTVSGALVSGGTVSGNLVTGGTVTGGLVTGGTVSGAQVSGGTVTGSRVTGGTVTGVAITGNTITGGTVTGGLVSGGTVTGALITGGTVNGGTITGSYIDAARISGDSLTDFAAITGDRLDAGTVVITDYLAVSQAGAGTYNLLFTKSAGFTAKNGSFEVLTVDSTINAYQNIKCITDGLRTVGVKNNAFYGIILKDTVSGLSYLVTVASGVVTATLAP